MKSKYNFKGVKLGRKHGTRSDAIYYSIMTDVTPSFKNMKNEAFRTKAIDINAIMSPELFIYDEETVGLKMNILGLTSIRHYNPKQCTFLV